MTFEYMFGLRVVRAVDQDFFVRATGCIVTRCDPFSIETAGRFYAPRIVHIQSSSARRGKEVESKRPEVEYEYHTN